MSEFNLFVEIDGQPLPLRECRWVLHKACGCVLATRDAHSDGDGAVVSSDAAWRLFTRGDAEKFEDWSSEGSHVRLHSFAQFVGLQARCTHDPATVEPEPDEATITVVDGAEGMEERCCRHKGVKGGDCSSCERCVLCGWEPVAE